MTYTVDYNSLIKKKRRGFLYVPVINFFGRMETPENDRKN
jgi:hypothetical protein